MTIPTERDVMDADLLAQVTEIVSAYVSSNPVSTTDLPALIADTHRALRSLHTTEVPTVVENLTPAVSVRKSVTPDYIVCLDDGKKFKSLKRHLSVLGMTPDEYRAKWGLPRDYPMVAPNYAATRSALAKTNGLGRKAEVAAATGRKSKGRA
jgi:predicted transcriptional regulator